MRRRVTFACVAFGMVVLGGCSTSSIETGSEINPGPVGIGTGIHELKGSPCACTEIPMTIPASARA